jgi:hypothetical protein
LSVKETGKQGIMKIRGMHRMRGVLLSAVIVISSVIFPSLVRAAQAHYSDDAIVRDLKAGKLTVREAQMLQSRRNPVVTRPVDVHKTVKIGRPPHAKPGKAAAHHKTVVMVAPRQRSRAPIRHLTRPHPQHGAKAHAAPAAVGSRNAVRGKTARAGMRPVKLVVHRRTPEAAGHHRAIRYIR